MKCIYKNRFGQSGELKAKEYLEKSNLKFIRSNYRFDRAEIDLIFTDEESKTLVFVEVKTRSSMNFGDPLEAVNALKQNQIRKAAMGFVGENDQYSEYDMRLDVVTVIKSNDKTEIRHYPNAF